MKFTSKISLTLGLLAIIIFSFFSGTIANATNQYASYFTSSRQRTLNIWIQNKIVSRKSTLSTAEYKTFISGLSTKLNSLLTNTSLSPNYRNTYGYILSEVDTIKNTVNISIATVTPSCTTENDKIAYYYYYNPDVKSANAEPIAHWNDYGMKEGRKSCWSGVQNSVVTNTNTTTTTNLIHSPDYPSLTRSIITPVTSYKEMLETVLNYKNPVDPGQNWIYSVGCKDINIEYNKKYYNPNHIGNITVESDSQATAFIKSKMIECTKGDSIPYSDGINIYGSSSGATFEFITNVFKDITPGNPSKGRIWVPAGTKITTHTSGYSPKSAVAFRWNAAPEGTMAAIQDIESIPNREEFFKKRGGDGDGMQGLGTGFGGLYRFSQWGHSADLDQDFISGKATRLGITCFDQESCGGNVFAYGGGAIKFKPKTSGWLYFDTLNFKTQTQQYIPKSHWVYQANGSYVTTFRITLEFDTVDLVRKIFNETEWNSNGEPK